LLVPVSLTWIAGLCMLGFFWLNGHSNHRRVKLLRACAIAAHASVVLYWTLYWPWSRGNDPFAGLSSMQLTLLSVPVISLGALSFGSWLRFRSYECASCGYNMTGNRSGRCPECGAMRVRR